jgi:hypothetical protein
MTISRFPSTITEVIYPSGQSSGPLDITDLAISCTRGQFNTATHLRHYFYDAKAMRVITCEFSFADSYLMGLHIEHAYSAEMTKLINYSQETHRSLEAVHNEYEAIIKDVYDYHMTSGMAANLLFFRSPKISSTLAISGQLPGNAPRR